MGAVVLTGRARIQFHWLCRRVVASMYCSPHPAALHIDTPPGSEVLLLGFGAWRTVHKKRIRFTVSMRLPSQHRLLFYNRLISATPCDVACLMHWIAPSEKDAANDALEMTRLFPTPPRVWSFSNESRFLLGSGRVDTGIWFAHPATGFRARQCGRTLHRCL